MYSIVVVFSRVSCFLGLQPKRLEWAMIGVYLLLPVALLCDDLVVHAMKMQGAKKRFGAIAFGRICLT